MLFAKPIVVLAVGACYAAAQLSQPYTDAITGISGQQFVHAGTGYSFGIAFPTTPGEEFIGQLVGPRNGWSGVSLGGSMPNSLLIVAWVNEQKVVSSFRKSTSYVEPEVYAGDAKATTLYSSVNTTHFSWTFRCEKCTNWGDRSFDPAAEVAVMGFAISSLDVTEPSNSGSVLPYHDLGMGQYAMRVSAAENADYQKWIDAASPEEPPTSTVTTTSLTGTTTPTAVPSNVLGESYDYIVVGGGAGGLVVADRLSESGAKVLLIERGPPSTYAHGGRIAPKWLEGKGLTRFDVPGLCNQIWADSKGIACTDLDKMAGCVLGGGTAVNAGMFFRPQDRDWDFNFPQGWKASDMTAATKKLFKRIPGTDTPSMDGKRYLQETYNVLSSAVSNAGWKEVAINQKPNSKYRTFGHSPFMYSNGERGGPLATYLVSAKKRSNFQLVLNTSVRRVIRTGSKVEGVEVFASSAEGKTGLYKLAVRGKVILSAGALSTPKILFRSGIGPKDQLQVVKSSVIDGSSMINQKEWIISPVGFNAIDHTNTDIVVSHPQVKGYDFYGAYNNPIQSDAEYYLKNRSGVLAGAAPGIPLVLYDRVKGADGIERQLQYTARSEGSLGQSGPNLITISQYLGTGMTSRGRITIKPNLDMTVSTLPYVTKAEDEGAIIQGLTNLLTSLNTYGSGLTILQPSPQFTIEQYVKAYVQDRGTNHWMGTAKMGTDDGTKSGGTSVVDCDTKVYGTDNLYVVDASIFPGMVATNPSAPILIAAEHAAAKILKKGTKSVSSTALAARSFVPDHDPSVAPETSVKTDLEPAVTSANPTPTCITSTSGNRPTGAPGLETPTKPKKCGGMFWEYKKICAPGQVCQKNKRHWWIKQYVAPSAPSKPSQYRPRRSTRYH